MKARLALVLAAALGCSAPSASGPGPLTVNIETDEAGQTALWRRLAGDELQGLALVSADAVLYPSAAAARAAAPKRAAEGKDARALHLLADEGDVVKVRTWLSPRVRGGMSALTSYDLTLYAARTELEPALREAIAQRFDDGSGCALWEGLPLSIGRTIQPREAMLARLGVTIDADKVALSFPLQGDDPGLENGEELGCDAEIERGGDYDLGDFRVRTRIYAVAEERERQLAQRRSEAVDATGYGTMGLYGRERYATCTLVGSGYDDEGEGGETGALELGGRHFASPMDVPGDRCHTLMRAYRARGEDRVLLDLPFYRAVVRLAATKSALRQGGRCGAGSIGFGGGGARMPPAPPPKVLAARGKTKVYFPDGKLAGYHMQGVTTMHGAKRSGSRLCIEHPNVSIPICFERADLVEIDDR